MIGRVLRSRGARKFRRNRMAMASLAVILAYSGLALWIVATNAVNRYGVSLEGRPVLGALLVTQTRAIVGPREMPGFGLKGDPSKRYEAGVFYLELARSGFDTIDRQGDGGRDPRDILSDYAIAGRPLADRPLEELREIYARGEAQANRVLDVRRQIGALDALPLLAGRLASYRDALDRLVAQGRGDSDEALNRMEDCGFTLEEIVEAVEAHQSRAGEDDPLHGFDPAPLVELAEAYLEGDPEAVPERDPERLTAMLAAAEEARGLKGKRLEAEADALAPIVAELFPERTGLDGWMQKVRMSLGTDRQGRSILIRSLYSAKIAIQVGVVTALVAVAFGSVLGAAAAFFGGWVDHSVNWLYSMFTSIPYLVLLAVLAMLFLGSAVEGTLIPLYVAFALTYWIGPCRVIRGESMKIKELEYVQAATAIGFGRSYILLRHIIPNTSHLMFINFSLLLIAAIKGEVILTFLGLGLKEGASWGIMIRDSAQQVVNDNFWQMGAATFFMFGLVLAFNIFTDALQDAFDPRHVG